MSSISKLMEKKRACEDLYEKTGRKIYLQEARAYEDLIEQERERQRRSYDNARERGDRSCFLTTACVEAAGLPDNCEELEVLRHFRDSYVRNLPIGPALLEKYYNAAPSIVAAVMRSPARQAEMNCILSEIRHSVCLIKAGGHEDALSCYRSMFSRLHQTYLEKRDSDEPRGAY